MNNQEANFRKNILPHLPCLREGAVDWLSVHGFFTAPASTKYHGAFEGGLYDHSFDVTHYLLVMTNSLKLAWQREESPYLVGMFHDLCKIDQYIAGEDGSYHFDDKTLLHGHGEKSVMLLSTLTTLTMEEVACIRYHMGAFTDKEQWREYTEAIGRYPNVLFTHTADMLAAHYSKI
jgi:hypothetical protein